ncbi:hypothetical protein [Pseudodonghicola flavimaris]|uniref:Calcium-binding protein n=1 Tax=Pseudodonghicola flavimaris TaxID=3050036 RepID=A0ABT7F1I3_9RHOB|nr:hypothetical protein [Pseudodonghicola flavimaris]MDK3018468.1 hypothetical protein [Pseudodonghicola flavimaris]
MRITYSGTDRDDVMSATSAIRESLYGLGGDDVFYFYGPSGVDPEYDVSDRFFGGNGADLLQNITLGFDGIGGLGQLAQLSFDGGRGYDTLAVTVAADLSVYGEKAAEMDLGEIAPLLRSVEHRDYRINLGAVNDALRELTITGSALDETVTLSQTASLSGAGEITVRLGGGADEFNFAASIFVETALLVDTGRGADLVRMNGSATSYADEFTAVIRTRAGADTIVLEGMYSEKLNAGAGDDRIFVLTGSFAEAPDVIRTGTGKDRVYLELDSYSSVAKITDFSARWDRIVFDADETRDTGVTFSRAIWTAATEDVLYMNNAAGKLYYGDTVLVDFGGETTLSDKNFITDSWDL